MNIKAEMWKAMKWKYMKRQLGFNQDEIEQFRRNPRNEDVIDKALPLMKKTIIMEVVESHGCNSQHGVGDKLYFDGAGNLLSKRCPDRVCVYALHAVSQLIFASNEVFYCGSDPNEMRFKRVGCWDVGLQCGGWGHVVFEFSMIEE